jgi:mono/diheme cytochrome c family protein
VQGLPLVKPPWGRISAIDLGKGELVWQIAHGETPDGVRNHPALKGLTIPRTGRPGGRIGTLVTKTLVIAGEPGFFTTPAGVRGAMLRAYDKATGAEVGSVYMPAPQTGSPMTYMLNGEQYLVIATSGATSSGELLAFKLPIAPAAQRVAPPPGRPVSPSSSGASGQSVWDGVYTEEQARRGKALYAAHCLACHGESLEGSGPVRPLTGPEFAASWNGLSMGDILDRTRTSMPIDKPGTLSRQQIADILSFVLIVNRLPTGDVELPGRSELLRPITFLAQRPPGDPPPARRQR